MLASRPSLRPLVGVTIGLIAGFASALILGSISPAGFKGMASSLAWVYTSPAPLIFTLTLLGPIARAAVGLTLAYRAGFITIGSEGQILLGSIVTLWLIEYSDLNLHPTIAIPTSIVLGVYESSTTGVS